MRPPSTLGATRPAPAPASWISQAASERENWPAPAAVFVSRPRRLRIPARSSAPTETPGRRIGGAASRSVERRASTRSTRESARAE
jgi:hypothetical protein